MSTATLSVPQRLQVARAVRANQRRDAADDANELNVIPFLDIVMNVLMFVLATSATVFTASLTPAVPPCCGPGRGPDRATVQVTPGGYVVALRAGFVAPDCRSLVGSGGLTVPRRDGRHDAAGLTRCLATLRASDAGRDLRGQRTLQVGAVGEVAYGELVRAIDAARETRPGAGDLFPEVTLGAVR